MREYTNSKKKVIVSIISGMIIPLMLMACQDTSDIKEEDPVLKETQLEDMPIKEEQVETPKESLFGIEGNVILQDDDAFYFCSSIQIMRVDKNTGDDKVLWTSDNITDTMRIYGYSKGEAVLIDDKIYFVETIENVWDDEYFLSVIDCEGNNYKRILKMEDASYSLAYKDNILYVFFYSDCMAYEILPDGTLGELAKKDTHFRDLPSRYRDIYLETACYRNSQEFLFAVESLDKYGCFFLKDEEDNWMMVNPQTGVESELPIPGYLELWNQKYLLSAEVNDEKELWYLLYLTDAKTKETRLLAEYGEEGVVLLDMDDNYVYFRTWEDSDTGNEKYVYHKLSLLTGESSILFSQDAMIGITYWQDCGENFMEPRVKDGIFYYIAQIDGKLYLACIDVENPDNEVLLGEAFYDDRISEVGSLIDEQVMIYSPSRPDLCLTEIEAYRLKLNDEFPGAAKINEQLKAQTEILLEEGEDGDWEEREQMLVEDDIYCYYSFYSCPSRIQYYDGKYLSFYQDEHYYYGGAHGMPYHEGYTFDLETGEEFTLSDIVGNSEEELKEIVITHYETYMSSDPEVFWEDALEVVEERINLEDDFYLTEKGIAFEFPPYDLAPYAAGYQTVVIPYSEFEIKIELE